jgi:hypothetical protein
MSCRRVLLQVVKAKDLKAGKSKTRSAFFENASIHDSWITDDQNPSPLKLQGQGAQSIQCPWPIENSRA